MTDDPGFRAETLATIGPFEPADPNCQNCDGTGWVTWTNKRKEVFGQPCHMCELAWKARNTGTGRDA